METFRWLEGLKNSIRSDFQEYEKRCSDAKEKVLSLEKERGELKEQTKLLQAENARFKENLARLEKEVTYKDEKLRRKTEEFHSKERWWDKYRKMSELRYRAMKKNGTFPLHILEGFVNKDMKELMSEVSENSCGLKENDQDKTTRKLSTIKSKKKVRYGRVSGFDIGEEPQKRSEHSIDNMKEKCHDTLPERNVFDDEVNESTMLYHPTVKTLKPREKLMPPEILIPETEFDGLSEAPQGDNGLSCSIGAPSAASTPVAVANTPPFTDDDDDDDNDDDGDHNGDDECDDDDDDNDDDDDDSGRIIRKHQTRSESASRFASTTKAQLKHLPKSDSQLPVDLSHTQPPSPTIPSRLLQQDLSLTLDCSVSLLPHGMKDADQDLMEAAVKNHKRTSPDRTHKVKAYPLDEVTEQGCHKSNQSNLKQTSIDSTVLRSKVAPSKGTDALNFGKRKRQRTEEVDEIKLFGKKNKKTNQTDAVFKVPALPPPVTPEVVLLDFTSSRKSAKYSSNSGSGESPRLFTSGVDLFDDAEDATSPDYNEAKAGKNEVSKEVEINKAVIEENHVKSENCPIRSSSPEPGYKYVEVVRKRDARAKLNGYPCRECQEYYEKLDLPAEELKKRVKCCSRHRAKFSPPPSTPPGFWNLSFPDTQEYMDKGYLKTESQAAPIPKKPRRLRRNKILK